MTRTVSAVIGLGSNIGDRRAALAFAVQELRRLGEVVSVSPLYETAPVGPPQPAYLNAAVLIRTELAPRELLSGLLEIERRAGRERRERWGPRTLDLDILWGEGWLVSDPDLTVPHPELKHRAFALAPLLAVLPEARDPVSGESYADALRALDQAEISQVFGSGSAWFDATHR